MRILGIETSCDETSAAIVEASGGLTRPRFRILSNIVSSQATLHAKYGGVVPTLAKREHQKNLPRVLTLALKGTPIPKINAIAVTIGPGLEPALWAGINFAKTLAAKWKKPLIGVNHLEGHIYSNWLQPVGETLHPKSRIRNKSKIQKLKTIQPVFPAVCLIVSGGHTELILMEGHGNYRLLGETRDDAAGEAYDKVARLLGLGFPGGPIIDKIVSSYPSSPLPYPIKLPRPMLHTKDYDFSFAGLKTAVRYLVHDLNAKKKAIPVKEIAAEFQAAVIDVLKKKTLRASREYGARSIMISGGVSANSSLRAAFEESGALFPPLELTGDNAAMIAMAGYIRHTQKIKHTSETLSADANLQIAK